MRTSNVLLVALLFGTAMAGAPTPHSASAAKATAHSNALCQAITPFYWQIGDTSGALVSGSVGLAPNGTSIRATTKMNVGSSSKMIYGAYVLQTRGSVQSLSAADIDFLHLTSGYTNMGVDGTPAGTCPPNDVPNTVNTCLTTINASDGLPYSYQDPTTVGYFDYGPGHDENHAGQLTSLGNVANNSLGPTIAAQLGTGVAFSYSQPLMAGGVYTTPSMFALILRHMIDGSLVFRDALGLDAVCTVTTNGCTAIYSPIPEAWHYALASWVEDDPSTNGDGAFSAPGAEGFYPWIEASKSYYGLIGRAVPAGQSPSNEGYQSAQCGRLLRRAWDTGIQQTGSIPTP